MLLGVAAQAQNQVVTATTVEKVRKNVVRGNSANYGFGMINDTLTLVGLNSLYRVALGDNNSIQNRTLTLSAGTGVLITGGTQNLTENRTWTISLPQSVSTSASPTFVGINLTGNANFGGNVGITGNLTVTGNSIFNGDIFSNANLRIVSAVDYNYESRLIQTDERFSISNYHNGTGMVAALEYLDVFNIVGGYVGINTIFPSTNFHVSGGAKIENTLELNDIPDVRAAIISKLNTSTAASTYAPINNATLTTNVTSPKFTVNGSGYIANGSDVSMGAGSTADVVTYNPSGRIMFSTAGSVRATITNAGNFGIGTMAPTAKFEVSGSGAFKYNDGAVGAGKLLVSDASGVASWQTSTYLPINNPTSTGTANFPTIANTLGANFATTSGNVGIGTVSPTEKLYVVGNSYTSGSINTGNSVGLYNVNQMIINPAYGGTVAAVQVVNNAPLSFITNNFQRLTITGTGNVGIGTTSPAGILHAASTTSFALLCPMTTTQRNALSGLVSGAEIYCSDCTATDSSTGVKQVYNGSTWKNCW